MKKIFAMAMAVVAMAVSMTSCNNDDAEFIEQQAPAAQQQKADEKEYMDLEMIVAMTAEQKQYFDEAYVIEVAGQQETIELAKMTPVTREQALAYVGVESMVVNLDSESEAEFYICKLGKVNNIYAARIVKHMVSVRDNHPADEFDYLCAAGFLFNGTLLNGNGRSEFGAYNGIHANDEEMQDFIKTLQKNIRY